MTASQNMNVEFYEDLNQWMLVVELPQNNPFWANYGGEDLRVPLGADPRKTLEEISERAESAFNERMSCRRGDEINTLMENLRVPSDLLAYSDDSPFGVEAYVPTSYGRYTLNLKCTLVMDVISSDVASFFGVEGGRVTVVHGERWEIVNPAWGTKYGGPIPPEERTENRMADAVYMALKYASKEGKK